MMDGIIITTVQFSGDGYLLNGNILVPNAPGNRHHTAIQEWIAAGNTPDPDPAQELSALKEQHKIKINEWREDALIQPVTYNSNSFDADERSQNNINSVLTSIQAGVAVADPIDWRTADNITVQLTHVQLAELAGVMLAQVQNAYDHSWDLKAQVDAAIDETAVNAIVW